jgi:hypothetical protein
VVTTQELKGKGGRHGVGIKGKRKLIRDSSEELYLGSHSAPVRGPGSAS